MKLTPEQRKLIADEMTRILATDDLTPLDDILRRAIQNIKERETKCNPR